ncbi:PIN domain-containing protein [Dolichospermum sp. LEGE 00240]|uniref:type II toxin-antitoxin system VapC family toxin n=1 Tax=Dolichospermum sp. LEGE 00240 TaxID=1828603 RepID=UPI00187F8EF4|nr:PIN domain-containing protein [Dolichospermum sp. LEGE 00240]MDM3844322.1 PIN domain-containing protein [Aphanizomenon gracile PMC638.10]MDM3851816.1 PIN domain-containing protein [Aphanizomenon gracile PMC627.10]
MKILLDTNIIIDNALEREPFWNASEQVLSLIEQGKITGYISASTFSDLYYIIRKARGRDWTLTYLNQLVTFCQIATVNQAVITMAFTTNFKDFEDAIQYSTAVVNQLDAIITRNSQDFPVVTPRILTPDQLIEELTNSP